MSKLHGLIFNLNANAGNRSSGGHKIATALRQQGWDVEVIDYLDHFTPEEILDLVRSRVSSRTVFFGFSVFFNYWPDYMQATLDYIKKKYPDIATIIGGQSVTKTPAVGVDYWVDSFGEKALFALLKNILATGSEPLKFDPYFLKQGKKVLRGIHDYPAYPSDSYLSLFEKRDFVQPWEWGVIEFSRGCKFKCDFCNFPILGVKGDYSRSQEDFELQMRHNYDNFGIHQYQVADETFNDRPDKVKKFADVVERLNFKPYMSGFIRADLLFTRRETWDDLIRLGMFGQFYGVESFNHDSLRVIHKGYHPDKVKQGLLDYKNYMKGHPYKGSMGLILSLPYETEQTHDEALKWLIENWSEHFFDPYVLDLGPDNPEILNTFSNVSSFRKNLQDYGLERMTDAEVAQYSQETDQEYTYEGAITKGMKTLPWKHNTMNIFKSREVWKKFMKAQHEHFRPGSWELVRLTGNLKKSIFDIDLDSVTLKNFPTDNTPMRDTSREYALKKLNL